ncbi:hypothetical protein HH310_12445 [Actinoplanes sp. TBRC 11911]|uniref:hypothetical protein n=1 Tax=Actinoplanes sp. TBRC 11911 TaxID=2729386 RepID=UPI00145D10B0|nr:hypothetical protein [Actinoplanes sp. TBRC 11911]NMO52003.1 hypothetical protein [Actinoplanes sp. TBRC 11911]
MNDNQSQSLEAVRRTALAAFAAGVTWRQALAALAEAKRTAGQIVSAARPRRGLKGCPSEAAYRRHLKAREKCQPCRAHVRRIELERRARHPEWWVRGAGLPVSPESRTSGGQ